MYFISDKGPIEDLLTTMNDPVEELMYADFDLAMDDWLQNMKRW